MINKPECRLLGSVVKPHGTKGSMLLWLRNIEAEEILKRESVFVEIDGLLVPFFVEEFRIKSDEAVILKLEGVNSETRAKSFAGLSVYMLPEQLGKQKKSRLGLPDLIGYKVTDCRLGFIGIATALSDVVNNPLLLVKREDKEFLIPIHEDIILEINDNEQEIRIEAPEGLFDL